MNDRLSGLYREHWHELCRYVRARFGAGPPEPEDVVQMAFLKFAALNDPKVIENPRAFLVTAAHHIVVDHNRRQRVQNRYERSAALDAKNSGGGLDDSSPERVLLAREEISIVRKVFEKMPELGRRLFLLQRLEGLSYAELARRTGLSQTTVKYHVAKALAECSAALAEAEGTEPKREQSGNVVHLHGARR